MTINTNNVNAKIAGNVIVPMKVAYALGWTASKSQTMIPMVKSNKILYGNRAVVERDGSYYIKSKKQVEFEVVKTGENRYEVQI
jgi:hypothetical protein